MTEPLLHSECAPTIDKVYSGLSVQTERRLIKSSIDVTPRRIVVEIAS